MIFDKRKHKNNGASEEDPEKIEQEQLRKMNLPDSFEIDQSSLSSMSGSVYRRGIKDEHLKELRNGSIKTAKKKSGAWL